MCCILSGCTTLFFLFSFHGTLRYIVLCCVVSYAMSYSVMLCYVVSWCAIVCYTAIPCYTVFCSIYAAKYYVMKYYILFYGVL